MDFPFIDSHQHFWRYQPAKHNWIDDAMSAIRKDFLPADLQPLLQGNHATGCVAVQADQTEEETNFLISLSNEYRFIKAVVGWVDLRADNIEDRLSYYKEFAIMRGFRHVLQGEVPGFMLQQKFLRGIKALKKFDFSYDLLIFPGHLSATTELVKQNPGQLFVIDHIAKPPIKKGLVDEWKKGIESIAQFDNVYCKISGLVTEADYAHWDQKDFTPYLDVVVNSFGIKRVMFGSDWPVCLVAATYADMFKIVLDYFSSFTVHEQQQFFAGTAQSFYKIKMTCAC